MAKNREHLEKPAVSGSKPGDDEAEASSEETGSSDSGSESESEQGYTQFIKKPSSVSVQSSVKPQKSTSSSDDKDSGSDTDSGGHISKVKPFAARQVEEPQKSPVGKKKSKHDAADTSSPAKPVTAKRSADVKEDDVKDGKKRKKAKPEPESLVKQSPISGDDSKKPPFHRIFSEEDEIVILEGLLDYSEDKKVDPLSDMLGFHEFILKKLHVNFTRAQLQYKLRGLKKKYDNSKKRKMNDKSSSFSKPLEQKAYKLSERLWGSENGKELVAGNAKSSGNAGKNTPNGRVNTSEDVKSKEVKDVDIEDGHTLKLGVRGSIFNGEDAVEMILKTDLEELDGEKKKEIERGL